VKTLI
jgi:hypothetical protein